ncbi:MAG TPA: tetratricopeptide repeat protein [Longimicrobium sp.]|jgi:tetratricopeptide (TPR) repeat protein
MKPRRSSEAPLPRSPLDFVYPLTIRAPGAEGGAILAEVRDRYALAVLRALRLVLAWSRGPDLAAPLFRREPLDEWEAELHAARIRKPLRMPLIALAAELRRPERADPGVLAQACFAISEWALGTGAESTALLFAEAAALVSPTDARRAWIVGRMLRNAGRLREGELWLRRAARVAVWCADWETQDLALNSLGNLYLQQGSLKEALRYLVRALKLARRFSMKEREAAVSHDLFPVYVLTGDHSRAEKTAIRTFDLYGPHHPNLPKLAHDVVQLWLRQGRFPLALPVLRALLPCLRLPHERLRVLAATVRAAGACRDSLAYEEAWAEAWDLVQHPSPEVRSVLPAVLVDLGFGAGSLSNWERAAEALRLALQTANERGAYEDAAQAELGLEMVQRYERIETPLRALTGPAADLSDAFVRSLESAMSPDQKTRSGGPRR